MARQGDGPIELYEAAVQGFRQTLSGVQSGQMGDSTPCTEWDVQKLIIHNLKVFGFAAGVLVENITVDSMQVEGPIPEGDPVKALDDAVAEVYGIIKAAGSVDTQINTRNCSELRGSEQPAAFQEGIETSGPPGAKEGCQGHLAVGALP